MSPDVLNQAIIGAKFREARELKLLRIIAYMSFDSKTRKELSIYDFYPLMFDGREQPKISREEAEAIWAKQDAEKLKNE